jgi:hypothetical protein
VIFFEVRCLDERDKYAPAVDEHGNQVNVNVAYLDAYRTYVAFKRGEYHFYDKALENELYAVNFEASRVGNSPEALYANATEYYAKARECYAKALAMTERQLEWAERAAEIKREMERADREGFARMFGE